MDVLRFPSETVIEASADRVWEIIRHEYARIGDWATAIPASRPMAGRAGAGKRR